MVAPAARRRRREARPRRGVAASPRAGPGAAAAGGAGGARPVRAAPSRRECFTALGRRCHDRPVAARIGPWVGVCAAAALAACGFDPSSAGGAGGGDGASDASPGAADAAPGAPDGGRPPRDAGPGDGDAGAAPGRQKAITIPAGRVGENLDGFPLYVELVDDTELAARAAADGSDIHFRTQNGTPLAHEIQRWDPASGRLEAWVRVSLSAGASTVILLR